MLPDPQVALSIQRLVGNRAATALVQREPDPQTDTDDGDAAVSTIEPIEFEFEDRTYRIEFGEITMEPGPPESGSFDGDAPEGGGLSTGFRERNHAQLDQIPGAEGHLAALLTRSDEDELTFLLQQIVGSGSATRVEYSNYDWKTPRRPPPLTHQVFLRRNPGIDPLTAFTDTKSRPHAVPIWNWGTFAGAIGGWDNLPVSSQHWDEIREIRDEIVYPMMRIVLPRLEAPGELGEAATVGERIAHRAHVYLGVRYATSEDLLGTVVKEGGKTRRVGGRGRFKAGPGGPEAADPAAEQGAMDCSTLVQQVFRDLGLPSPGWTTGAIKKTLTEVAGDPQPGDVLFRPGHVAISIGNDEHIHAPHTGGVVRKNPGGNWAATLRYQPSASE